MQIVDDSRLPIMLMSVHKVLRNRESLDDIETYGLTFLSHNCDVVSSPPRIKRRRREHDDEDHWC